VGEGFAIGGAVSLMRRGPSRRAASVGRCCFGWLACGVGVVALGCESEGIRPRIDRSSEREASGAAGTPSSGAAGDAGTASGGEPGAGGAAGDDSEGGAPAAGGSPASGGAGAPVNEGGEGGADEVPGRAGASAGGSESGGTPGVDPPTEAGAAGSTPADGGAAGATPEPSFPCAVGAIIETRCQRCHQDPPQNGAPFPLLTWSDTRAEQDFGLVYELMLPAIESDYMPLTELELDPPVEPLSSVEKRTLLDWLEAGAKPAREPSSCP